MPAVSVPEDQVSCGSLVPQLMPVLPNKVCAASSYLSRRYCCLLLTGAVSVGKCCWSVQHTRVRRLHLVMHSSATEECEAGAVQLVLDAEAPLPKTALPALAASMMLHAGVDHVLQQWLIARVISSRS